MKRRQSHGSSSGLESTGQRVDHAALAPCSWYSERYLGVIEAAQQAAGNLQGTGATARLAHRASDNRPAADEVAHSVSRLDLLKAALGAHEEVERTIVTESFLQRECLRPSVSQSRLVGEIEAAVFDACRL